MGRSEMNRWIVFFVIVLLSFLLARYLATPADVPGPWWQIGF